MPSKYDKMRLPHHLDKRVRLTDGQKIEIKSRVESGDSIHSLAAEYGVSRRTIQFAAYPDRYEKALAQRKERWRTAYSDGRYYDREAQAVACRDIRRRKKEALCE